MTYEERHKRVKESIWAVSLGQLKLDSLTDELLKVMAELFELGYEKGETDALKEPRFTGGEDLCLKHEMELGLIPTH